MPLPSKDSQNFWSKDSYLLPQTVPVHSWGDLDTSLHARTGEIRTKPELPEWALVVYAGSQLGRVFPLSPGDNVIGRSSHVQMTLLDEEVSRMHANVHRESRTEEVRIIVEDLGSTNGTFVNGEAIEHPRQVSPGDRITVGCHILKLVVMDALERSFHETLVDQSTKDPLTDLGNRAVTLSELRNRFDLSQRYKRPFSLVICDLDHFKLINDTHGHGAGDLVLAAFGERVRQCLRATDLAGRIGGEEFLLLLPETDIEGAVQLAERVRTAMGEYPHPLPTGAITVTCSFGVAERCDLDADGGALLGRADVALYASKAKGRNCVTVAIENA